MRTASLSLLVGLFLVAPQAVGQGVNTARPPEIHAQHQPSPEQMRDRVGQQRLEQDAKDLSDLCATIPADMDRVRQGLVSKDLIDKLKRIEKLSKRVRDELSRGPTPAP